MQTKFVLVAAICLGPLLGAVAQKKDPAPERAQWRAASKTAEAITGDIGIGAERLIVNFVGYPAAELRALRPDEVEALSHPEAAAGGAGKLFRLHIPAATRLLHKNTLCGSDDTTYMATFAAGRDLRVAFFSGGPMPVLTEEALRDATNLCGTYAYTR